LVRSSARFASAAALVVLSFSYLTAVAQQQAPATAAPDSATPAQSAPASPAPGAPVFPAPNPADFTAATPTKEVVNAFMQANLGWDDANLFQVQAIEKTQIEGISRVVVFIGDRTGKQQPYRFAFFTTPDGKHMIVGDRIVAFGEHPFADYRAKMQQSANGPYRGAASKDLELVEFADFQCPHCKAAQANMDKLATDFPKARIVFQNDPITTAHPQAPIAAAYGNCVAKEGGSTAFFQFAAAVFDGQDGLGSADGATLTLNSAVTKAGLDLTKITACASLPETKAAVDASVKLAADVNIASVPALVINGRQVPANTPYETLKEIVQYQAKLDGVSQ
jgi:protein-disulfide isomerase